MKHRLVLAAATLLFAPSLAGAAPVSTARPDIIPFELVTRVAATWSCTPRKTCTKIRSCDEARWYHLNCSWGGRLDGDNDGIPCESLCR